MITTALQSVINPLSDFINFDILSLSLLTQIFGTFGVFLIAYVVTFPLKKYLTDHQLLKNEVQQMQTKFVHLLFPVTWVILQWTLLMVSKESQVSFWFIRIVANLLTAWVVTRVIAEFIKNDSLIKFTVFSAFGIAFLNIFGLVTPALLVLDNIALNIGELHLSVLSLIKGGGTFAFLLWGTLALSRSVEEKVKNYSVIEPSLQALSTKLIKVIFIATSILVTLSSMGLDLSAFAIFGGAVGVGIGFGLQKVVSNLICGIILLLDRSVKPGDVIALDGGKTYGVVNKLGARYASVRTRSGKEHLIPNENFITEKTESWSYSDRYIRLDLPIRASLDSDVPLVMELLMQAFQGVQRVLTSPSPGVRLLCFGENAIEFELRLWVGDPQNGVSQVKSDVYVRIWKLFKQHGIHIPLPQRDIHFKGVSSVEAMVIDRKNDPRGDTQADNIEKYVAASPQVL